MTSAMRSRSYTGKRIAGIAFTRNMRKWLPLMLATRVPQRPTIWRLAVAIASLTIVLAFLGHDLAMAATATAHAESVTMHPGAATEVAHLTSSSHPEACGIGPGTVLKEAEQGLPHAESAVSGASLTSFLPARGSVSRRILNRTRSPAAPRALLQVFRI